MKRILKVTVDRPTNATDSVSLVREWLYNRRSELISATVGDEVETKVSEICKKTGMTSSIFSRYRDRLIKRGIIMSSGHGYVSLLLPRFEVVASTYE